MIIVYKVLYFVEIVRILKNRRCYSALAMLSSIVGSSIGDPESDTHLTHSEAKSVWNYDLSKQKYELYGEHYAEMESTHYYAFQEPSLYQKGVRLGPVGVRALELW